jgi:hypothetical protein
VHFRCFYLKQLFDNVVPVTEVIQSEVNWIDYVRRVQRFSGEALKCSSWLDCGLRRCDAVQFCRNMSDFPGNLLFPSSEGESEDTNIKFIHNVVILCPTKIKRSEIF